MTHSPSKCLNSSTPELTREEMYLWWQIQPVNCFQFVYFVLLRQTFIGFYVYKAQLAERTYVKMLLNGMFTHIFCRNVIKKKRFYSHTMLCCSDKTNGYFLSRKRKIQNACAFFVTMQTLSVMQC